MKYILFIIVNLYSITNFTYAQVKVEFEDVYPFDTLYILSTDSTYIKENGYLFPEYDFFPTLQSGISVSKNEIQDSTICFEQINDLRISEESLLFLRIFTQNISSLQFNYPISSKKVLTIKYAFNFDGYQDPINTYFAEFDTVEYSQETTLSKKACFKVNKIDSNKPQKLVFGELLIHNLKKTKGVFSNLFFDYLGPADSSTTKSLPHYKSQMSNWLHLPAEYTYVNQQGNLELVNVPDKNTEMAIFKDIIRKCLEKYPFYKERMIHKDTIISTFDHLANKFTDTNHFCELENETDLFLKTEVKDPHFYIRAFCHSHREDQIEKTKGPIRVYRIKDGIYVAAVLNSKYREKVPLGSRIIEVDDVPISDLIREKLKEVHQFYPKSDSIRMYNDIISNLLAKEKIDSTILTFEKPDGEVSMEQVQYDEKLEIPSGFIPRQCEVKFLNDSILYFRINVWSSEVYSRLVNNWSYVEDSKGIIFDIRSNGGGDHFVAMQIISLLIKEPETIYYYANMNGPGIDSLTIAPDKFYKLDNEKKVAILIDNGTASASEIFTMAAQKFNNVVLVGKERTMGSVSNRHLIQLPSGVQLAVNTILAPPRFKEVIEAQGIKPDIIVPIHTVNELQPYEDKVLKEACKTILHNKILIEKLN